MSNLFWGMQFRTCRIFWDFADHQSSLNPQISYKCESYTANTRIVDSNADSTESPLRGESIDSPKQSKQNNRASAHRISPDSWCKKSESKGAVVPPADFLLESDKRGTPPKSEKAAAFWRVGGAGWGVQPFLREETSESKKQNSGFIVDFIKITDSIHLGYNP